MATLIDFAPSQLSAFQFQATLDGNEHTVIVTWALFGRRYYVNVYDPSGRLVVSLPMVGSPSTIRIAALTWDPLAGLVTATAALPLGLPIGAVAELVLVGTIPETYNGVFRCAVISAESFTFPIASDPGLPTAFGTISNEVSLVGGYFTASRLVYREANRQFEISP